MDINDVRAAITLLAFVSFLGIVFWAYHRKSRRNFDEAAQLPFAEDAVPADDAGRSRRD
jgi:cytochrome c oxidase cbb3-type subunit 4